MINRLRNAIWKQNTGAKIHLIKVPRPSLIRKRSFIAMLIMTYSRGTSIPRVNPIMLICNYSHINRIKNIKARDYAISALSHLMGDLILKLAILVNSRQWSICLRKLGACSFKTLILGRRMPLYKASCKDIPEKQQSKHVIELISAWTTQTFQTKSSLPKSFKNSL